LSNSETFFKKLTRLFRSGPAIQRRVKGHDSKSFYSNQLIQGNYGYKASAPFGFGRENSPFSVLGSYGILDRMSRYAEFEEMCYCLHGDTKIAVPDGYKTIKELSEEYGLDKDFIVYSYDHNKKQLVPAIGKQARLTKHDHAYKVIFENGQEIIGTENHRLMKRDGTYCVIGDLKPGDSMMPFYRRDLFSKSKNDSGNGYRWIYTMDFENSKIKNGWIPEHRLIAAWKGNKQLLSEEVVHHINFKKYDNRPENLVVMSEKEHFSFHSEILNKNKWSEENKNWIEKFKTNHSIWMKNNNPNKRNDITFHKILGWCEKNSFNIYKVAKAFDTDNNTIKLRLRENGYENFIVFSKAYRADWKSESWNNVGSNNPRYRHDITFEKICQNFSSDICLVDLAKLMSTTKSIINKRLVENGYKNWSDFKLKYKNHKVLKVEYYGHIPLYDLTVNGYKNFATDSVISHNSPEIAAALDIYADETMGTDERGKCFHVYSKNAEVKSALDDLFYDVLNVEFNLRVWVRNLVKYGDFFLYNEVAPDAGIIATSPIPVNEIEREEGFDMEDPYAIRFKWLTRGNKYLENWQIVHFRILNNDLFLPYGTSLLEPARRIARQLTLLEDAMLVYRVVRSPERRAFFIDVGGIAPTEVENYMNAAKATLRSQSVMDRQNGREDQRLNAMSVLDDFFIPVRGQQTGTRIETLSGGTHATAIDDIEYVQKKLFAALKVPKPYLNFDENLSSKASLAQMDVRFSRTISIMQKIVLSELNKLAMVHLFAKGFDGEDLVDFELKLSNPSSIAMQQKLELWSVKFDIAGTAKDTKLVDQRWVQRNILELTEEEIESIDGGILEDKLREAEIDAAEPEPAEPNEQAKTTDLFNPTNYLVPGQSVAKSPAQQQQDNFSLNGTMTNTGMEVGINPDRRLPTREDEFNIERDEDSVGSPIKATPFLTRHKRNRKRRVGVSTGRSNTAMPDMHAMLSPKNKYNKDIYGSKTESIDYDLMSDDEFEDFDSRIILEPIISRDMKSMFEKMKRTLKIEPKKYSGIITEGLDDKDDLIDIEIDITDFNGTDGNQLLLSEAILDRKTSANKQDETIEEKTLKDIFDSQLE
jgi:hypothetical protein